MEMEAKIQLGSRPAGTDFMLRWGSRKRLRCFKVKKECISGKSDNHVKKKITSRSDRRSEKDALMAHAHQTSWNYESSANLASNGGRNAGCSPEKEDRYYTTRGSAGIEENSKPQSEKDDRGVAWPKLVISLSNKEKEEDFMAMKGCKLPHRPKKRAKIVQRSLLLVSPGAWLSDLCQERYEVREKKASKKKPRGLKAMGNFGSDSD